MFSVYLDCVYGPGVCMRAAQEAERGRVLARPGGLTHSLHLLKPQLSQPRYVDSLGCFLLFLSQIHFPFFLGPGFPALLFHSVTMLGRQRKREMGCEGEREKGIEKEFENALCGSRMVALSYSCVCVER